MAKVEEEKAAVKTPVWLPEPTPVVRPNGDSVVELRQNGVLVGELNFTLIVSNVVENLFGIKVQRSHLKAVE